MSTSERHQRVSDLFSAARRKPAPERAAFLDQACRGEPDLRAEVESLLSEDRSHDGFLESPAPWSATCAPAFDSLVGTRVGQYQVERLLAEGGMGTVYEAFQEHPRRAVALKVIRHGPASESAVRRFTYEWQVLGRLQHPGIAQIYDAGIHGGDGPRGGFPYFAMEYVRGARNLIEYCESRGLGRRARIELFIRVCEAVSHGHQRGVIHRDLKPGNILVSSDGQPKVIDFGVARAIDTDQTLTTVQTMAGQVVGTVQYMSPEQAAAHPEEVDTRSDVYSLGVVLYELLCRQLPYDISVTPLPQAIRLIQEVPPRRPSTVERRLRGDLETIVLKAMEKDRQRRYQSVGELARDLRRYLDREPIMARPPSPLYQWTRFVQRHRGVSAAAVVALIGLAAFVFQGLAAASKVRAAQQDLEQGLASIQALLKAPDLQSPDRTGASGVPESHFRLGDFFVEDLLPAKPRRELLLKLDAPKLTVLRIHDLDRNLLQELQTRGLHEVLWNARHRLLVLKGSFPDLAHVVPELAGYDSVGCPDSVVQPVVLLAIRPENVSGFLFPFGGPQAQLEWALVREPAEIADPGRRWMARETELEPLEADDPDAVARIAIPLESIDDPNVRVTASAVIEPDGSLRPFQLDRDPGEGRPTSAYYRMIRVDLAQLAPAVQVPDVLSRSLSQEETERSIREDRGLTADERELRIRAARALMGNWRWLNNTSDPASKEPGAGSDRLGRALEWAERGVQLHAERCARVGRCKAGWYVINTQATVRFRAGRHEEALVALDQCDSVWTSVRGNDGKPNALDLSYRAMVLHRLGRVLEAKMVFEQARGRMAEHGAPDGLTDPTKEALNEAKQVLSGG
jgi:serine/threonine protein kinase